MDKPRLVVVGHGEAETLLADQENLAVPSLVRIRSGQGVAYMADAGELRAWRASQTTSGEKA
jgi:hypothetical protein